MAFIKIKNCLACGSNKLRQILNLSRQPLANSFLKNLKIKEKKYELKVKTCLICSHLQLSIAVDPKKIYQNYDYLSGTDHLECCLKAEALQEKSDKIMKTLNDKMKDFDLSKSESNENSKVDMGDK